ncbi:transposon Tf2-6 polyprotein [Trichonephila clavipes]|nr:transposon Tf2-6 polyprotein [Trichonephila clavipes]
MFRGSEGEGFPRIRFPYVPDRLVWKEHAEDRFWGSDWRHKAKTRSGYLTLSLTANCPGGKETFTLQATKLNNAEDAVQKLYQLLKNLLAPDIPSDQTLDKLKDALKKHLTPKPLIIPSRHKLLNRKQTEGEDWPAIKAFRAKTEQNLNNLLREYKDIFDDKLGEINNYEAKLKLRHGVKPIFCRVRTVPFALKGRVENEIDRLEKEGIIEKVDSSGWATPVVPVVKSDGSIRLCTDYSVTLNPNLIVPQHPLPRLDEIFGSLRYPTTFGDFFFKFSKNP